MTRPLILAALLALAGCSPTEQTKIDTAIAKVDLAISHFCTVNQPVVGKLTKVIATGVAAAVPQAAVAAPIAGITVALVDGACASIGGVDAPAPAVGASVVVVGK